MSGIDAGWYDDGHGAERWWDGNGWTEHLRQPSPPAPPQPAHPKVVGEVVTELVAVEAPASVGRENPGQDYRVPLFGARKAATHLAERVRTLEAAAEKYGHLTLTELDMEKTSLQQQIIAEKAALEQQIARAQATLAEGIVGSQQELARMQGLLVGASAELDQLRAQIIDVRELAGIQELGLYNFEHPAESSAELATRLESTRAQIKQMIQSKTAATASANFTFNNSTAKGNKFVSDMTKILLRAYNAEAENCVKTVRAGNLAVAQKRLTTAMTQIARQGSMIELQISSRYHHLRLEEIELANRHLAVLQTEKELERERREELREQRKAEQELQREKERLDKERSHYQATLNALRAKGDADGVARMEAKLADVQRAIDDVDYRAANIRAGYVYVISNKGAFGDSIVKIGMTRRLEPMDRVRELGDASVPFRFDVHALFFADDAVGVEAMLHRRFGADRVNRVNLRREFFRVTPAQVLEVLREESVEIVEFTIEVESEEYAASRIEVPEPA